MQVVGVALNGVLRPGDLDEAQSKLSQMDDAKFRRIFGLLYSVNQKLDLFAEYQVERIFECRILSVDCRYRGRGLARSLLQRSIDTARDAGFQVGTGTPPHNIHIVRLSFYHVLRPNFKKKGTKSRISQIFPIQILSLP